MLTITGVCALRLRLIAGSVIFIVAVKAAEIGKIWRNILQKLIRSFFLLP